MEFVRELREKNGRACFFTVDAGPNVHVLTASSDSAAVASALQDRFPDLRLFNDRAGRVRAFGRKKPMISCAGQACGKAILTVNTLFSTVFQRLPSHSSIEQQQLHFLLTQMHVQKDITIVRSIRPHSRRRSRMLCLELVSILILHLLTYASRLKAVFHLGGLGRFCQYLCRYRKSFSTRDIARDFSAGSARACNAP